MSMTMRAPRRARGALAALIALAACTDGTSPPLDPALPEATGVQRTPAATPGTSAATGEALRFALTGGGIVTEVEYDRVHGFSTTLLPASGALVDVRGAGCCQVLGDTVLQVLLVGTPRVGRRIIPPPSVDFTNLIGVIGSESALLSIKRASHPGEMRWLVQTSPAELEVTLYSAPSADVRGEIRGRVTFTAQEYYQERTIEDGLPVTRIKRGASRDVVVDFVSPMRYQRVTTPPRP